MVANVLKNESAALRSETRMVLLQYKDFDAFSNNQSFQTSINNYGSLEDLHNKIHDKTGGPNGHMRAVEVSAFDPIFWLHHWLARPLFLISTCARARRRWHPGSK